MSRCSVHGHQQMRWQQTSAIHCRAPSDSELRRIRWIWWTGCRARHRPEVNTLIRICTYFIGATIQPRLVQNKFGHFFCKKQTNQNILKKIRDFVFELSWTVIRLDSIKYTKYGGIVGQGYSGFLRAHKTNWEIFGVFVSGCTATVGGNLDEPRAPLTPVMLRFASRNKKIIFFSNAVFLFVVFN